MPKFFEATWVVVCGPKPEDIVQVSLAQPGETATSKKKTGTDQKFVANSVYELQSILFMLINYS